MFPTNSLEAGLIISATTAGKYRRLWRRSLYVGVIICLKKTTVKQPHNRTRSYHAIDVASDEERRISRIVKEKDLVELLKIGGVDRVVSRLRPQPEGIAIDGNQVSKVWNPVHKKGFWYFLFKSLNKYTVFLLLLSAMFSFSISIMKQGIKNGWHDGAAILVAVILIVAFPSVENFYNQKKMEKKLLKDKNKLEVKVERGGEQVSVSISNVVVGEIVYLTVGDHVPADGLLLKGEDLKLDEVLNPKIDSNQNPFLLSGSKVINGHGSMIVTSIGADTALGEGGLTSMTYNPVKKTLVQSQMDKTYVFIDNLALFVSILIAFVVLIRFLWGKHDSYDETTDMKGEMKMNVILKIFERIFLKPRGRVSILASVLAAVIIGIQHGMPFVITVSLCYWKEKFASNQGNPQNLSTCGNMGLVSVICIDVSGQFCNPVEVKEFWIGDLDMNNDKKAETDQLILEALDRAIGAVPEPRISVSQANDLLISWAKSRWDVNMETVDKKFNIVQYKGNSSSTYRSVGILMKKSEDDDNESLHLHFEGVASTILGMCSHYYDSRGEIHAMEEDRKSRFEQVIENMEINGLRPIAFACNQTDVHELSENGLKLLAIVGLKYQCTEDFKATMKNLRDAGVNVILVSEDELSVAKDIAYELGIFRCGSNNVALEGAEIRPTNGSDVQALSLSTVIGNALPKHKLDLVERLRNENHVVAFLGGLTISDTPALREADVGITMDCRSTKIAQMISDIIITRESSLSRILMCGRYAYLNIQMFCQLQLTACISGLLITFVSTICLGESPIATVHLIWVHLVMCLLSGLMMGMELKDENSPISESGRRNLALITKVIRKKIIIQVIYQASLLLIFEFLALPQMNEDVRNTMIFNTFTLCQIFNQVYAMEILNREVFVAVLCSYWFLVAFGAVMILQVMLIEFAGSLSGCERLSALQWGFCFLVAALSWSLEFALNMLFLIISKISSYYIDCHFSWVFIYTVFTQKFPGLLLAES